MNKAFVFKLIFIFLLILGIAITGSKAWKDYQVEQDKKKMEVMYSQILEGASTSPPVIKADFKTYKSKGSSLVFGGSHTPPIDHTDAWNKIEEVGVTSLRKDLYIEFNTPSVSLEDYKNNIGNVRDVQNWDIEGINKLKKELSQIKSHGMKTVGIMSYAPSWLTYNNSPFGVPKDWEIYKDIVKKTYLEYRDVLDYIEIWNEPDHRTFLVTEGSNISKTLAYKNIYYYASAAIREVDKQKNDGKQIPIGAAVESNPTVSNILESVISDSRIVYKPDFISFHNYDESYSTFLNVYKTDREKYLDINTPIFITEWNLENTTGDVKDFKTGNKALLFTADRFINYFNDGINGANYFAMLPINSKNRGTDENTMGFYRWNGNQAEMLPQAKTWRLMSNKMKLGKGESLIYSIDYNDKNLNGIGFKNTEGQYGIVMINKGSESKLTKLNLTNMNINKYAHVEIYYASADNDAKTPVYSGDIKQEKNTMNLLVYLPKDAVIGVLLSEDKNWFDFVNLPY